MSPKTPVFPVPNEGAPATPGDRNQVAMSPSTESAEAVTRKVVDETSNVNLKILEALTSMQDRMARLELSQLKREEEERMKGAQETGVFQSTFGRSLARHELR